MEVVWRWVALGMVGICGILLALGIPMFLLELPRWSIGWCFYGLFGGDRPKWEPIFGDGGEHFTGGV